VTFRFMKFKEIIFVFAVCIVASTLLAVLMWTVVFGASLTWAPLVIGVSAGSVVAVLVTRSALSSR